MRVVSDAGPIIHLSWIDRLGLLGELFAEVLVPPAVRDEVLPTAGHLPGLPAIRAAFTMDQLSVREVLDRSAVAELEGDLHRGEAEAIVLMQEARADLLLVDDRDARRYAQARGLAISGTIGILRLARERGLIESALPLIYELQRLGFRISEAVIDMIEHEEGDLLAGR